MERYAHWGLFRFGANDSRNVYECPVPVPAQGITSLIEGAMRFGVLSMITAQMLSATPGTGGDRRLANCSETTAVLADASATDRACIEHAVTTYRAFLQLRGYSTLLSSTCVLVYLSRPYDGSTREPAFTIVSRTQAKPEEYLPHLAFFFKGCRLRSILTVESVLPPDPPLCEGMTATINAGGAVPEELQLDGYYALWVEQGWEIASVERLRPVNLAGITSAGSQATCLWLKNHLVITSPSAACVGPKETAPIGLVVEKSSDGSLHARLEFP